jgi:glucosamine 6-phosphate synthetase-like amidotransferase/phosphosugar isomerase protein
MNLRDYGYKERAIVLPEDDCFTKLENALKAENSEFANGCGVSILHSRMADLNQQYNEAQGLDAIPDDHAHPNIDYKDRIALFHNGRIANSEDLLK